MSNELKARIVSSFVMAVVAIAALWSSIWTFTILILVLAMAVCWEWGRAVRGKNLDAGHAVHSATMFAVAMAAAANNYATALCLLLIGALAVALVSDRKHWIFSIAGVFYIGLPATALIWLRSDDTYGIHAVLFILFVVYTRILAGESLMIAISFLGFQTWDINILAVFYGFLNIKAGLERRNVFHKMSREQKTLQLHRGMHYL